MLYSEELKVGVYRFDYADGNRNSKWTPKNDIALDKETAQDCTSIIAKVIEQFPDLNSIQDYCDGIFYEDTKLITNLSTDLHNYCVRLYPTKGEYNCYIYIYKKEKN